MNHTLILGNHYTKKELSSIFNQKGLLSSREGIFSSNTLKFYLFFVDLVKEKKKLEFQFNDYFEQDYFHWDSQPSQHINVPRIKKIINKEIPILLFTRVHQKIKSKFQPFVYCGGLEYLEHDENLTKPVHIIYQSLDYDESTQNQNLIDIYNWKPEKIGKTTSNNTYKTQKDYSNKGELKKPNNTERSGLVTSRVGQGWYRQEILKKWDNKCSITKCSIVEILISSHIKGWSECNDDERLDPDNGILLSPNIDSLFDKHFISFEDDGSILISDKVSKEDLEILGITKSIKLKVDEEMKKYLKHHRIRFNNK